MILNLILTFLIVIILYSFSKTLTFYKLKKRITLMFFLRIPCQYLLIEQKNLQGKAELYIMGIYKYPFIKKVGNFIVPRVLFKEWYPEVLKTIEDSMIFTKEETENE